MVFQERSQIIQAVSVKNIDWLKNMKLAIYFWGIYTLGMYFFPCLLGCKSQVPSDDEILNDFLGRKENVFVAEVTPT